MISDEIKPKQPAKYGDPGYFFFIVVYFIKGHKVHENIFPKSKYPPRDILDYSFLIFLDFIFFKTMPLGTHRNKLILLYFTL